MSAIAMIAFGGQRPRAGNQLIGDAMAEKAMNCLLLSGELRGLHAPVQLVDLSAEYIAPEEVRWAYRIPDGATPLWAHFSEERVDFMAGPLTNDKYDRFYYTRTGHPPAFLTKDDLRTAQPAMPTDRRLGVVKPTSTMTITTTGGTGTDTVTRAYVYTYVNSLGEESAPSEPVTADGKDDATWQIADLAASAGDIGTFDLDKIRIYRTVTGTSGVADYFLVDEIDVADTTYDDDEKTSDVSLNDPLSTYSYSPPPDDLEGLLLHPNGFFAGFVGKDLYFSEPYRPHAWPTEYILSTEHDIVGLAIFGNSIAVMTEGHPYVCTGISPASLTLTKYQSPEPCTSFRGIVPIIGGVIYPSFNGLMLMGPSGVDLLSEQYLTIDEWREFDVKNMFAARFENQYICFHNSTDGFMYYPSDELAGFSELGDFWDVDNLQVDPYTGNVFMIHSNRVSQWNPPNGVPLTHKWKSKEYVLPKPSNLAMFQVDWREFEGTALPPSFDEGGPTNSSDAPTGMAFGAINTRTVDTSGKQPQPPVVQTPDPVYTPPPPDFIFGPAYRSDPWMKLRVWCNGVLRYDGDIDTLRTMRLPAGFKGIRWQFEFETNGTIKHAKFAEVGGELASL